MPIGDQFVFPICALAILHAPSFVQITLFVQNVCVRVHRESHRGLHLHENVIYVKSDFSAMFNADE